MKIALLNNITPQEEQDVGVPQLDLFQAFFAQALEPVNLSEYRVTEGELPTLPNHYDAYLISGSTSGAYEDKAWILELSRFVQRVYQTGQQKLVGICFGHQLLAHVLGGETQKSSRGWGLGRRELHLSDTPHWMTSAAHASALYYAHQDQVVRLPEVAQCLAGSAFCPNEMFVIQDRVLGIQGHPEFSAEIAEKVVDVLSEQVPAEVAEAAEFSLAQGTASGSLLSQWIVNFIDAKTENYTTPKVA